MSKQDNRDTIMALCTLGVGFVLIKKFVLPWWVKKMATGTTATTGAASPATIEAKKAELRAAGYTEDQIQNLIKNTFGGAAA